jgi:predicted lysophospholipase L1 biosynthesis ABC-type transport system permease subunit
MVALAGLMTIGSTTAAFAQAVHARHEAIAIHRSMGASPVWVLKIVVLDACKLAIPATLLAAAVALVAISVLDRAGLLSVFGVRFATGAGPLLLLLALLGAVFIAVCSAVLALLPALSSSPAAVWHDTSRNGRSSRSSGDVRTDEQE